MAGNRVTSILEIVTKGAKEAIGSFRQIASSTNDASTATNRATTANDTYHRGAKALYQTNLAQGRQISKLRAEIGGSSGLVAAYATLAANVFAASAAFSALSKAAQLDQLTQSLNFVGNAAGTNLGNLVTKLREVTGEAISTEQALRSASLGVSAGFSPDQLTKLARVARGASLALGRDMTDAMDRLTRGAAKLEPEILDELGIIVRLDTATAAYAAQVGKAVDQLTQYERTQAFINAINEQGEKKFGAVADAIDPNPYDKLAAALSDLSKDFLNTINSILKFTGIIDSLTSSTPALVGAIVLFASTISRQLLPALYAMPVAAAKAATRLANLSKVKLQADFTNFSRLPDVLDKLSPKFVDGTASAKDFAKGLDSANKSIRGSENALRDYSNQLRLGTITEAQYAKKVAETTAKLEQSQAARQSLMGYQNAQRLASINSNVATGLEAASQFRLIEGVKALNEAGKENAARLAAMSQGTSLATRGVNTLKQGFFVLTTGVRFFGAAVLSIFPYLGLLLTFGPMIYNFFENKFFPKSTAEKIMERVKSTMEGIKEEFQGFAKIATALEVTFMDAPQSEKVIAAYKALAGVAATISDNMQKSVEAATSQTLAIITENTNLIKELQRQQSDPSFFEAVKQTLQYDLAIIKEYFPHSVMGILSGMFPTIQEQLDEASKQVNQAKESLQNVRAEAAINTLQAAIDSLSVLTGLKVASEEVKHLRTRLEALKTSGKDPIEILIEVERLTSDIKSIDAAIQGIPTSLSEIQKAQNELVQKQTTPLDTLISKYKELNNNILTLNKNNRGSRKALASYQADIIAVTGIIEDFDGAISIGNTVEAVQKYVDNLQKARNAIISIKIASESLEEITKGLSNISSNFTDVLNTQLILQNYNLKLQEDLAKKRLAIASTLEEELTLKIDIAKAERDIVGEQERAATVRLKNLDIDKQQLDITKSLDELETQRLKNQQKISSIYSLTNSSIIDGLALIDKEASIKEDQATKELDLAIEKINIEETIAEFRLKALQDYQKAELEAYTYVYNKRIELEQKAALYTTALNQLRAANLNEEMSKNILVELKPILTGPEAAFIKEFLRSQQSVSVEVTADSRAIQGVNTTLEQTAQTSRVVANGIREIGNINVNPLVTVNTDTSAFDRISSITNRLEQTPLNIDAAIRAGGLQAIEDQIGELTDLPYDIGIDVKAPGVEQVARELEKLSQPITVTTQVAPTASQQLIDKFNNVPLGINTSTISSNAILDKVNSIIPVDLNLDKARDQLSKFIAEINATVATIQVTAETVNSEALQVPAATTAPTPAPSVAAATAQSIPVPIQAAPAPAIAAPERTAAATSPAPMVESSMEGSATLQSLQIAGDEVSAAIDIFEALLSTINKNLALTFNVDSVIAELRQAQGLSLNMSNELAASADRQRGILEQQRDVAKAKVGVDTAAQILALAQTKAENDYLRILNAGAATNKSLLAIQIDRNNEIKNAELREASAKKTAEEKALENAKTDLERKTAQENINALSALESSIRMDIISDKEIEVQLGLAALDIQEKQNKLLMDEKNISLQVFKNNAAIENMRKGRGSELNVEQQLKAAEIEYNNTKTQIELEAESSKTRLKFEAEINAARLAVIAAELEAQALIAEREGKTDLANSLRSGAARIANLESGIREGLQEQISLIERSAKMQRDAAEANFTATKIGIVSSNLPQLPAIENTQAINIPPIDLTAMIDGFTAARAQVDLFKNQIIADSEEIMMKGIQMGQSLDDAAKNANEKADLSVFASKVRVGFDLATAAASPFIEQLKGLGPEGQYVAAIAQGGLQVVDSISTISEAFATLGDKTATSGSKLEAAASIMQSVGASIGAIGAMQQAASAQRVAEIDKEIAAEKKRDGKSKESLAKIAALEKKKVQEEKKAFERNKKMKMAEIVINTAAAVMGIWSGVKDPFFSPVIAAVQSALVIGLGAAQLAIVSGTSFQGGGSIGGASVPTSISVGERSNKVDVAQRPTGGELAYIQGERGMGTNANNFRPAFMGARYRATGGYIVGEQGPELFVPETPGRIVPNDEMGQMGTPVNVSFNVSAIDAVSFNDMLADQKGNIISIIREAANSYGQPFLEGVNTITMAPAQRNYYRKA